jgi:hypothetical protein
LTAVVTALADHAWARSRRLVEAQDCASSLDADRLDAIEAAGRLNALVVAMLGAEPALEQLARENSAEVEHPTVSPRTSRRIILALEEALDGDPLFAADLTAMVARLRPAPLSIQPLPLKGPAFANAGAVQGGLRQNGGRW